MKENRTCCSGRRRFCRHQPGQQLYNNPHFRVTVVDQNNYNFFPPLLYQVATGSWKHRTSVFLFGSFFKVKATPVSEWANCRKLFPKRKRSCSLAGDLSYDYLVLATGTETNFFGLENVKKHALPMKTVNDAIEMRNYLLQAAEKATVISDPGERRNSDPSSLPAAASPAWRSRGCWPK